MFAVDQTKTQGTAVPMPEEQLEGIIISPDTRRENRIPPGQSRTLKWPILDAFGAPKIDQSTWSLSISGLVNRPVTLNWAEFLALPRVKVFSDFHCVTRWSRLGNVWEGVSVKSLVELAGGLKPEVNYVVAHGFDQGWTTNMPLAEFMAEDALVAFLHDGADITLEHGGPARLIVPQLYAWKSAKWLSGLEFREGDQAGFWERNGYHMNGDPWREQRYGY